MTTPPPVQDPHRKARYKGRIILAVILLSVGLCSAGSPFLIERAVFSAISDNYDPPPGTLVSDIAPERLRQLESIEKVAKFKVPGDAQFLRMESTHWLGPTFDYWFFRAAPFNKVDHELIKKDSWVYESTLESLRIGWPDSFPEPQDIYERKWDNEAMCFESYVIRTTEGDFLFFHLYTL